jgi:hypothetical protein
MDPDPDPAFKVNLDSEPGLMAKNSRKENSGNFFLSFFDQKLQFTIYMSLPP